MLFYFKVRADQTIKMNKMKIKTALSLSLITLCSQHLYAAQATEQSVNQLIKVMNIDSILQQTLKQIRPQMDQQAYMTVKSIVKHEQLNPQEQIVANQLADKMYEQSVKILSWEQMKPMYQQIYKTVYSAEEVEAQIDFYSSTVGQAILQKSPLVAQESMKIVNGRLGEIMKSSEKDFKEIQSKLDQLKTAAEQAK